MLNSGNVELCQQTPTIPSVLLSTQGMNSSTTSKLISSKAHYLRLHDVLLLYWLRCYLLVEVVVVVVVVQLATMEGWAHWVPPTGLPTALFPLSSGNLVCTHRQVCVHKTPVYLHIVITKIITHNFTFIQIQLQIHYYKLPIFYYHYN